MLTSLSPQDSVAKDIVQCHFLSWPDHLVPQYPCTLLSFMHRIRSSVHYQPSKPITVHCSAGIGRTGTFILLDTMLEMAQHEKQVDVLAHLCAIRQQRINLVERINQYVFVYQTLVEALSHEPTNIECNQFAAYLLSLNYTTDSSTKTTFMQQQFRVSGAS